MKTILIVDDSAFIRDLHRDILESADFQVIEAQNGMEALTLYDDKKPDAVLMDLLMPEMDGIDVIKNILAKDPQAITIVCSTDKQKYRKKEAKEVGAKAFISKPVDGDELIEIINKLLYKE
jgi:two-component system chemotaxis response regulator CheY